MSRSTSSLALVTLLAYATVLLVPCLQAPPLPQGVVMAAHAEQPMPADARAVHDHGQVHEPAQAEPPPHDHSQAHGHGQDAAPAEAEAHAAHAHDAELDEGAEHASAPSELRAVCLCGCDGAPKAASSTTRVPWGIAAAVPGVPRVPVHALASDGLPPLPAAPSDPIDHVPIPA